MKTKILKILINLQLPLPHYPKTIIIIRTKNLIKNNNRKKRKRKKNKKKRKNRKSKTRKKKNK